MTFLRDLGAMLPASWKNRAREAMTVCRIARAADPFSSLEPGAVPPVEWIQALKVAWGNPGWSAEVPYLDALARAAAKVEGPILECGSGVSTLILALVAAKRGIPVVALEHDQLWQVRVANRLDACGAPRIRLLLAPLRNYGDFSWYDAPPDAIPSGIRLVVCDGPPQSTPGGRYGVIPILHDRLAPDVAVLLDDATRPSERDVLARWEREAGLVVHAPRAGATYALVQRGSRRG